ncbi:MAG: DUF2116 family Zn-ribbon domain-containing protein [Lachnospiraceae bacterium]|jgi:endogenous inhibitor of DNA gyrase (YacG/DUF329 family)|nr:DUF2116 family Zn-ribbon domain-containing protein [Lachnospiraceae bacterium]
MNRNKQAFEGSDGPESTAAFFSAFDFPFRGHSRVSWTGGAMEQDFDSPDISEFIAACAKRFCPECGKPIEPNKTGRPRSFCSDRCRWAFDKRRKRLQAKEAYHENSNLKGSAGEGSETGSLQPEEETEAGRQGISKDQGLD